MKYFLGDEGSESYKKLKVLRDKFIAHNESISLCFKATHKDIKILEALFDEKLENLATRIKEDILPAEIDKKDRVKIAKEFWNQV